MGLSLIRTGWYLVLGLVFGGLSFMRTNAYKRRTGSSPWHIHPVVWGVASVFIWIFGTLLSIIACSTGLHPNSDRSALAPAAVESGPPDRAFAAWLTDPTGRHELRYFDGTGWTAHVANSGVTSLDSL